MPVPQRARAAEIRAVLQARPVAALQAEQWAAQQAAALPDRVAPQVETPARQVLLDQVVLPAADLRAAAAGVVE